MSITLHWDNEDQTIIRWDFDGRWDWTDMHSGEAEAQALCQDLHHTVDYILNMEETRLMPKDAFPHLKALIRRCPDNTGIIAFAGSSLFIEMLVKTFSKFNLGLGDQFVFVDSLPEARELLHA